MVKTGASESHLETRAIAWVNCVEEPQGAMVRQTLKSFYYVMFPSLQIDEKFNFFRKCFLGFSLMRAIIKKDLFEAQ